MSDNIVKKQSLNIIITNSLQNDFIEKQNIEHIKQETIEDPWKIDYDILTDRWHEYFRECLILPDQNEVGVFLNKLKDIPSKDIPYSYHKFLEHYHHRVHVDIQQTEKLWSSDTLPTFILDLKKRSAEANQNKTGNVYYFIHLRDWHDPTDQAEREELCNFGYHCIKGSHGAQFISPLKEFIEEDTTFTHVINSNSLSSFSDTNLESILESIITNHQSSKEDAKIGVFGVITNIKLKLLTFELKVIHGFKNVYVCKDLSAGFNQKGHEDGLKYMENVLGVKLYNEDEFREEFQFPKVKF